MIKRDFDSYIGKTVGYLTVLELSKIVSKDGGKRVCAKCVCKCGKEVSRLMSEFSRKRASGTPSCGCYKIERALANIKNILPKEKDFSVHIGKMFNYLTVLDVYREKKKKENKAYFKCQCKCGTLKDLEAGRVVNNYVKSCGCLNSDVIRNRIVANNGSLTNQEYKKEYMRIKSRENYLKNHEKNKQRHRDYYYNNKEKLAIKAKEWKQKNKKHVNDRYNNKKKTDINFRLTVQLRDRIKKAIKNNAKGGSAVRDLGCTIPEFKKYIEAKFQSGMTWENWSLHGWHLDHIIPLDSFDLTDREQFLKACHYTNMQPLWAFDNLSKGNKIKEANL